jgi:hypothetical protein
VTLSAEWLTVLLEVLDARLPDLSSAVWQSGIENLSREEIVRARDLVGEELATLDYSEETWAAGSRGSNLEAVIDELNRRLFA